MKAYKIFRRDPELGLCSIGRSIHSIQYQPNQETAGHLFVFETLQLAHYFYKDMGFGLLGVGDSNKAEIWEVEVDELKSVWCRLEFTRENISASYVSEFWRAFDKYGPDLTNRGFSGVVDDVPCGTKIAHKVTPLKCVLTNEKKATAC